MSTLEIGTEPLDASARPTTMRRIATTFAALVLPLALTVALAGCGSDGRDDVARDPAPGSTTPAGEPASEPTAAASVGTFPGFAPTSYAYTLAVSCFCMGAGLPIRITVVDDEVTSAVYLGGDGTKGRGSIEEGDPADEAFAYTIDDLIERANDTEAARVDVVWPDGQAYPSSVYVDGDEMTADDESGYEISDVVAD